MVFADDPTSHLTYTVLPLFISACSCLLAATLALSSFAFHEEICTPIAKYTLVGSCCMLASCTGLWYIRQRYRTLHLIRYLIPWVLGAVFALLLPLGSTGYAIYGLYTLFDNTSGSSVSADICNSSVIYYPAWIVIIATFVLTLLFFPIAAKIIISRLLFMKPDSWWSDYEEHIDNIRWLRTSLGDLIPTLLVRSPNKDPKYTIIYSHGNASDLGIMIQGLLHLAKHVNCHIIVYDYPGYGLAANTGYLDEQHIYASIEAVYRAALCSQQNIWGEELPTDIILFGRSLGTAVSIHLAALLGDAERFGRYNGDITGTRGNRASAVGAGHECEKQDEDAANAVDVANSANKDGEIGISINSGLPPRSGGVSADTHVFPHSAHAYAPGHGPNNLSTIASSATPLKRPTYIGGKQVKHPERLCGVILDSPLTSIVRTKLDIDTTLFFDMFVSIDKIHRVTVPVRITHGTEDTVVPKEHAQKLIDRFTMPDPFPAYWLQDKGHNDLPKFWLYHTNKVKDPKERARLDKLNEETTQYLYNLRRFLQHCDAVSVYYSEVEPTEPTSIGTDDDMPEEEEEEDAENAAVEALAAAARHNKRTKDAVVAQRGHGHGHRLGRAQEEASPTAFSDEEDDGLLSLPPDIPIPRLALPFTSSNSDMLSNSNSRPDGQGRGNGGNGGSRGEDTLPLSPVCSNAAAAPIDSAAASARVHVANKPASSPSSTASASAPATGMSTGTGIVYPGSSFVRSPSPAPTARGGVVAKTPVQVAVNSARGRHRVEQEQQLAIVQGQGQEKDRDNSRSSRTDVPAMAPASAEGDEEAAFGVGVGVHWEPESEEEEGLVSIVVNLHESGGDGDDTIVLDDEVAHHRYA